MEIGQNGRPKLCISIASKSMYCLRQFSCMCLWKYLVCTSVFNNYTLSFFLSLFLSLSLTKIEQGPDPEVLERKLFRSLEKRGPTAALDGWRLNSKEEEEERRRCRKQERRQSDVTAGRSRSTRTRRPLTPSDHNARVTPLSPEFYGPAGGILWQNTLNVWCWCRRSWASAWTKSCVIALTKPLYTPTTLTPSKAKVPPDDWEGAPKSDNNYENYENNINAATTPYIAGLIFTNVLTNTRV